MELLLKTTRGNVDDLFTFGSACVVNNKGELINEWGDSKEIAFARSGNKLFQALSVLDLGALEKFDLEEKEIAQMCASHSGEDIHVKTVSKMLEKAGLDESYLKCGPHYPFNEKARKKMMEEGKSPRDIHNNCSGKHAGMLMASLLLDASLDDYYKIDHPNQKRILEIMKDICEFDIKNEYISIDGCGVPVHAMPLYNYCLGMAKFADYENLEGKNSFYAKKIIDSITKYPEYTSGTDRLDKYIISKYPGKAIVKVGSNGFFGGMDLEKKLGFCVKTYDGIEKTRDIALIEVLKKIDIIKKEDYEYFDNLVDRVVRNHRKEEVGRIIPVF